MSSHKQTNLLLKICSTIYISLQYTCPCFKICIKSNLENICEKNFEQSTNSYQVLSRDDKQLCGVKRLIENTGFDFKMLQVVCLTLLHLVCDCL